MRTSPKTPSTDLWTTPPKSVTFIRRMLQEVTPEERYAIQEETEFNVFNFPASLLYIDFLSDSGTCALTQEHWMGMMMADESYARGSWYYAFLDSWRDFVERGAKPLKAYAEIMSTSYKTPDFISKLMDVKTPINTYVNSGMNQLERPNSFILPQGRCCESILFACMRDILKGKGEDVGEYLILSNGLFDTTRANAKVKGFQMEDLFHPELYSSFPLEQIGKSNPFKGDINMEKLRKQLEEKGEKVALIVITMTNNTGGGQPVSMNCLKEVKSLCVKHSVPLWIDACRVNENAYFIQKYDPKYADYDIREIIREIFALGDAFHCSMKKCLGNMGGFMAFKDEGPFATKYPGVGTRMKELQIITYGNDSYGALSGRELASGTMSLYMSNQESYLKQRTDQALYVGKELAMAGVSLILPPGGHAIFLDMNRIYPERKWSDFVGVGFVAEMISRFGIRGCELGYMAWELDQYVSHNNGKFPPSMPPNLVRFAIPALVYSREHLDYFIKSVISLYKVKDQVPNAAIIRAKDEPLRHFIVGIKLVHPK